MVYNPNIPQANDDPSDSQADILNNFGTLNTYFNVNHVPFTAGGNNGLHTKVNLVAPLASDPDLPTPQSSLYTKTSGATTELFFQNGNLASNVKQLTNLPIVTTTPGSTGFGFVTPWGLTINTGSLTANFSGNVNFQIPYSPGFTILTALISPQTIGLQRLAVITSVNNTGFTYSSDTNCYFLVIGTT